MTTASVEQIATGDVKVKHASLSASVPGHKPKPPLATIAAVIIAIMWTIPTVGLLVTSFRTQADSNTSGWWTAFSDPGALTLDNYNEVLFEGRQPLIDYFVNSFVITIPAVLIPVTLASLAAYGFAWVGFRGRGALFLAIFALQIIPLQVALIPLLSMFVNIGVDGTFWTVWLAHTIFALPLAIYLLHGFMREVPKELIEAARVDGAGHVRIFLRVLLPLMAPALAAFAIFQFLWVWNDLLVAKTFLGSSNLAPLTARVQELVGTYGNRYNLLAAGAFISIIVPVTVFIAFQRFFVRGLLAGSVKG